MKKAFIFWILVHVSLIQFGQIIADHTVVDKFDDIPQYYIDKVKEMWLTVPGQSHSAAYRTGLELLESQNAVFSVNVTEEGTPEGYTTTHLRASRATWGSYSSSSGWIYNYGEAGWFTNSLGISRTKAGIDYCNTHGYEISAMGFGWCWDATAGTPTTNADPVYGCRWYGWSAGSPEGDKAWGLDDGDNAVTGNSVSLDTYLRATQEYIDYCKSKGYKTKVFFTTGTVDTYRGESAYQGHLKYERIRDYVKADSTRILFDYADILCYDDNGQRTTTIWDGNTYPIITPTNLGNGSIGHIGEEGAIRLAKAMWWMLARIAGWDGDISAISVTGITVTGGGGSTLITTDSGTLQLTATVTPSDATNKTVTWSVVNGTGQATINSTGLVTAVASGTVTARATANDGSGIVGSLVITISSQVIPVTGITVTGVGGAITINMHNSTLQLTATVTPSDATNKTVAWSVVNGTGQATINTTGLATAVANGTVTARATANDGSGVVGSLVITISGQVIPVMGITVTGAGGSTQITQDNGTLQLTATVTPSDATNKTVSWSVVNGTGQGTISSTGLVTAVSSGTVTVRATANDGSGVVGSLVITIRSQDISVTRIDIASTKGESVITSDNGTLQLIATIIPTNATNQTVTWSIINGTGQASIGSSGLVTAIANGIVTARATANDGSGVFGELSITITNQFIAVAGIIVSGVGGVTTINIDDGTLQMVAIATPEFATNKTVTWSMVKGVGHASISETGLITARSNGTVTVRAMANDGSNVFGELEIVLSNQIVQVSSIRVKPKNKTTNATVVDGVLQLESEILPSDATTQSVEWSVVNASGEATIDQTGLLKGIRPGDVVALASATDGSGVIGEAIVTIEMVESIKITNSRYELRVLVANQLIPAKASLYNLYGTHIKTKTVEGNECIFDLTGFLPGIYVVLVHNSNAQYPAKIVIAY